MDRELLKSRTKKFAHCCVKAAIALSKTQLGSIISKQLMRSATSVAANYRAACLAHSKDAFTSKLSIVIEETDESEFWLTFALDEKLLEPKQVEGLIAESKELCSIFVSSRKTMQIAKTNNK